MSKRKTKKKYLDSSVTQAKRQKTRSKIRDLQTRALEHKQECMDDDTDLFVTLLAKQRDINKEVVFTSEAYVEAKFLRVMSSIGAESVGRLKILQKPSLTGFLSGVRDKWGDEEINWIDIGRVSEPYLRNVLPVSFMNGPMTTEHELKARQKRVPKKKGATGPVVKAKTVDATKEEKTQTDMRVERMKQILNAQKGHVLYFEFVTNPHSFTQTVENIFDLSFLVKNQSAKIELRNGLPYVSPGKFEAIEAWGDPNKKQHQCVIQFNYEKWREVIDTFKLTKSFIPTRSEESSGP